MAHAGEGLGRIHAEIAAAGLDPGRWQNVVGLLGAPSGIRAHLWSYDPRSASGEFFLCHGIEASLIEAFLQHYAPLNPWPTRFAEAPVGRPLSTEEMCSYEILRRTEFHADWLLPQGNLSAGGGVILLRESGRYVALGGIIERRYQDRAEADWLNLIRSLAPALAQALKMNRALSHMALRVIAAEEAPGSGTAAALVIGRDRRIELANRPAEDLLRKERVIASDGRGRLRLEGHRSQAQLETALARVLAGAASHATAVDLDDIPGGSEFECRLSPLPRTDIPFAPLGPKSYVLEDLAVVIIRARPRPVDIRNRLRQAFGLSGAEAEVVMAFAEGLTLEEISLRREVSLHTTRSQFKSVRAKTGSRRQADLMRLVESLRGGR